jgi:hypothetical protein
MGGKFQAREMLAEYMGKRADREYQFLFSAGKDPIAVFWLYEKEMEESWMFAFQNDRPDIAYQLSKPFSIYLEYKGVYNKAIHYYNDVGLSFCNSKSPAKSDNYYYNLIIRLYNLAGIFYLRKGDGEKASQLFNSVESKIMERKNFPKQMPLDPWQKEKEWDELALYWSRGQQCILRNDSIKGEDYFIKSYELAKKSGMILPLTVILVGLGELFLATDANKALEFLIRAKNTEAGKNIPWIRSTIYPMIGMANMISGNIREARIYFLESLKYLKTFPFPRIKAQCFSFLAQLSFTSKEKKNLGAYYANHAIFICESIGDYLSAARFCLTAAQYSGEGSQPFNKNYYLEKAMEIANLGNLDELRPEIEKNLKI